MDKNDTTDTMDKNVAMAKKRKVPRRIRWITTLRWLRKERSQTHLRRKRTTRRIRKSEIQDVQSKTQKETERSRTHLRWMPYDAQERCERYDDENKRKRDPRRIYDGRERTIRYDGYAT